MTNVQLRERLKKQISKIDDTAFLMAIETILESKTEETPYPLSAAQKESIRISREQIRKGQYKDHKAVMNSARSFAFNCKP